MKNDYLKYGKITLRPLEPEDLELLYKWENNTAIWDVSNTKTPFSRHILAQFIRDSANDIYATKQLRLMIENSENKAVGAIDLFDFEPFHQRAGLGILIHKNEDRGLGYASDSINCVCHYAVHVLGLHQLYANIAEDNQNSIRLFQNCGFIITGIKTDWLKSSMTWKNELLLQKIL